MHLFDDDESGGVLYIHAKAIIRTRPDGARTVFVGSENISGASLNFNRELGVYLDGSQRRAIDTRIGTFDEDWAVTANVEVWSKGNVPSFAATTTSAATSDASNSSTPARACGPLSG